MTMSMMNPITIIKRLKRAYNNYASVQSLKMKSIVLSVIVLLLFDNILGLSYTLFINSKIDTIEHMIDSKPKIPETYFVTYKRLIVHEYINHRTLLSEIRNCFSFNEESNGAIPGVVLITSSLLPLFLMLIVVFFFFKILFLGKSNNMEHGVNLLLIFIGLSLCSAIMRWIALQLPMFFKCWIWNYAVYAAINIALFYLLQLILPEMREDRVISGDTGR